jgi:hypothetical protein
MGKAICDGELSARPLYRKQIRNDGCLISEAMAADIVARAALLRNQRALTYVIDVIMC